MLRGIASIVAISALAVFSNGAFSEVYQWVDEQGNVHFGDEKPDNVDGTRLDVGENFVAVAAKVQPIPKPAGVSPRTIFVANPKLPWSDEPGKIYSLGNYYVGQSCSLLPTAMNWPNANLDHQGLLATSRQLSSNIKSLLSNLAYPVRITYNERTLEAMRSAGGLLLTSEIIDLEFDACAPRGERRLLNGQFDELYSSSFDRSRARLRVRWTLLESDQKTVLHQAETSGEMDNWNRDYIARQTMIEAMESSLEVLLADADFVAEIAKSVDNKLLQSTGLGSDKTSVWDKLKPWKKYTEAAKIGSVLSEMTRFKMYISEYYFTNGYWPSGFADMGLSTESIVGSSDEIDDISISAGGRIEALLENAFGEGRFISLVPEFSQGAQKILWSCETNLAESVVPDTLKCEFY